MPQNRDIPKAQDRTSQAAVFVVDASRRHARALLLIATVLAVALAVLSARTISFNTDTTDMLSPDLPFRKANVAYRTVFPDYRNAILIVIDGANPDRVADGARDLAARLGQAPKLIPRVIYPAADPFFRQNGLLYLSTDKLGDLSDNIAQSQAFIATLANDRSLRGMFGLLRRALEEGAGELDRQEGMRHGIDAITDAVEARANGKDATVSWTTLMGGTSEALAQRREILVETAGDETSLHPGAEAIAFIHQAAADVGVTADHGLRVRLTGPAALKADELASVFSGSVLASVLSFALVTVIVLVGLRSFRLVIAVLFALITGLVFTFAFAALVVGTLNLISVAFTVLFIGIAVDFGIHFSLRYKEAALAAMPHDAALRHAATRVGPSLLLAGMALLIAFFSFLPTSYRGLAELGLISGAGMVVAVVTTLTLLPASLSLLRADRQTGPTVAPRAAALEAFVRRHARSIAFGALAVFAIAIWFAAAARFETNPLNLQNPAMESVATLRELMAADPEFRPAIAVVTPNLDAAVAGTAKLKGLPSVAQVVTAADLVPKDQERKLEVVQDMALFLAPLLDTTTRAPPPDAASRRDAVTSFTQSAKRYLDGHANSPLAPSIRRLADALGRITAGPDADQALAKLEAALLGGLASRLDDLVESLKAKPVSLADLPDYMRRSYLAPDGQARIEVRPKADLTDDNALRRFVSEVTAVFPNASGAPIQIVASADAVVRSFYKASIIAMMLIALLLVWVLRSLIDSAYVLAPLALAGTLTFAATALTGPEINFANIIVLPLLLGLGVSSGIYLVTRARENPDHMLLQTITPRAVVFSALTTLASFGSLIVSGHLGMASMGWLLLIAISLSLVCTMVVLPALLVLRYRGGGAARNDPSAS
jgi:hopanoid biosynthesis associated RND transporter like protein HpnN